MKNDRPKKLECLTRKILDGKVVPFLGAGISNDTEVPGCTFDPSAKALTKSLAESLKSLLGSQLPHFVRNMLPGDGNKSGLDERLVNAGLSRVAELHVQVAGEKETYEAMNIMAMDELVPSPAHFYITYIILEGCIEEIITTNYDCCLEKALLWANCEGKTPLMIRELGEYQCGGVPFCRNSHQSPQQIYEKEPDEKQLNVRIYKINGCIQKFIQTRDGQCKNNGGAGHTLILTEAQLQNWHHDWAREMFRDRLRTRTILFSGFGSEEPQIRHTMLEVLREFEQESNRVANSKFHSGSSNRTPTNMPYIAEYDTLSFPQHQILYSAGKALVYSSKCNNLSNVDRIKRIMNLHQEYAFTINDTRQFLEIAPYPKGIIYKTCGPPAKHLSEGLDKNLFWAVLYLSVIRALLVERYLGDDSSLASYLRSCLRQPENLLKECREELFAKPGPRALHQYFLQGFKKKPLAHRWHCAVLGQTATCYPDYIYPTFNRYPVILPLFYLMVWWLHHLTGKGELSRWRLYIEPEGDSEFFLVRISCSTQFSPVAKRDIYLVDRRHYLVSNRISPSFSFLQSSSSVLVLALTGHFAPEKRLIRVNRNGKLLTLEAIISPERNFFCGGIAESERISRAILDVPEILLQERKHWREWIKRGD